MAAPSERRRRSPRSTLWWITSALCRSLFCRCVSAVREAIRTPRACGVFGIVVFIVPTAAPAAGKRTSCPLTPRVHPFQSTTRARYDVTIADGDSGDTDGIANGTGELDLGGWGASSDCPGEHLTGVRGRVRGGTGAAAREEVADLLTSALATLPGGTLVRHTRVDFGHTPPPPRAGRPAAA